MKTTKILIGSGILVGAAAVAFFLVRRSRGENESSTEAESSSLIDKLLPSAVTTPAASATRVSKYPEGTLLRDKTELIYIIDAQGYRHWIPNWTVFNRMGLKTSNILDISNADMQSIPRLQDLGNILF